MSSSGLAAQPLRASGAFNWVYLVDWIVIGVLSLFFLFYFNRLLATVIAYFIRLYTWRVFKVYIDIEALQFSPLAGRIFFKGIRYHGDNETVYVHSGNVTWRYWLPRVKDARIFQSEASSSQQNRDDDSSSDDSDESKGRHSQDDLGLGGRLPCRISVKVSGVEAFIYNRTPAYDYVIDVINKREAAKKSIGTSESTTFHTEKNGTNHVHKHATNSSSSSADAANPPQTSSSEETALRPTHSTISGPSVDGDSLQSGAGPSSKATKPPFFLGLLPVHVECQKAAAILGNDNTPSIISAQVDSAQGEFDAEKSGPFDVFKILMGFEVSHPYIQMKPNVDYKEPQLVGGNEIKRQTAQSAVNADASAGSRSDAFAKFFRLPKWAAESLDSVAINPNMQPAGTTLPFTRLEAHGRERWHGLARYLDDHEHNEHDEWAEVDYAKASTIADLERVDFQFYWDIAGPVPRQIPSRDAKADDFCDINGSTPPEYGMKLIVRGGFVVYGPWADRNRIIFQQIFFPGQFADSVPTRALKSGKIRLCTVFKLDLTVEDETVVRIPFREPSKDASWKGRAAALTRPTNTPDQKKKGRGRKGSTRRNRPTGLTGTDVRPFAWFDITVKSGTKIHYKQDMFPRRTGYANDLDVNVTGVDISSSLNHALLWRSQRVGIQADLSYPLSWNGLRDWVFDLDITHLDFFLLRDHTFLLVDLIEDWSRGPQPDFYSFVAYSYRLNAHFNDFKLFLNTNDANIINNSESLEENEFVILYGSTLDAILTIPLDRFRPAESPITFDVNSTSLGFEMRMPPQNTLSELLDAQNVATLQSVELHGSYTYCSEVRPGLVETLLMEIIGRGLEIKFFGFFARQLAKIKENYFGETVHFRTLEEYQDLARRDFKGADKDQPVIEGNDLDVILDITAHDSSALLPSGLYDADEYVRLHVDSADVDLRVNNYYLELMVNSDPVELNYTMRSAPASARETARYYTSGTQLFIDGVKVGGHRLFGLPPSEPAYVSNWDIDAGTISGECQPAFFAKLIGATQSFALGLGDQENAVPLPHLMAIPDSTFVRFACPEMKIWCPVDNLAFLLSIKNVAGNFNDFAGALFSQRLNLNVPELLIGCFDATVASRRNDVDRISETLAHIKTSINMTMVQRNVKFEQDRQLQQQYLRDNDIRRGYRASFLYQQDGDFSHDGSPHKDNISLSLPSLPAPLLGSDRRSTQGNIGPASMRGSSTLATTRANQPDPGFSTTQHLGIPKLGNDHERRPSEQGRAASSVPLSSTFKLPHLNLDGLRPDLDDVPELSTSPSRAGSTASNFPDGLEFDDSSNEDTVHTTFMITISPGITALCNADAVRSIATLVQTLLPKDPTELLDNLHFSSIMEVISTNSRKKGDSSITDISVKIPEIHARFVNNLNLDREGEDRRSDRYNVMASDLSLATRIKLVSGRRDEADATSLHTTLGRLRVYALEGVKEFFSDEAAVHLDIEDTLIWLNDGDRTSVNASFRTIEAALASRQVDYLASLIHRTTMLVDEFQSRFMEVVARQNKRFQYIVYALTEYGEEAPDPQFLTRPSYVIRSSPEHVRSSDSWKIISRFHYTLRTLDDASRAEMIQNCRAVNNALPDDAERLVMTKLDSWRSWDAMRIRDSFVIRIVYGSTGDVEQVHDRSKVPVEISVRAAMIKVVVDPGEKESALRLDQLALGVAISPPPPPSAMQLFQDYTEVKSNIVQLKTSKIGVRVDWHICGLVDRVLSLFEAAAPQTHRPDPELADSNRASERFHIIVSSDITRLDTVTINVSHELVISDVKASLTGSGWQHKNGTLDINAAITSRSLIMALSGHSRQLLRLEVMYPSLWVAYEQDATGSSISNSVKVAGDSNEVMLRSDEDLIGFLEIAKAVICDEASTVKRMIEAHPGEQSQIKAKTSVNKNRGVIQVNLALFLNVYTVQVALLPGLVYATTGKTIRISMSPDPLRALSYNVNFDLKAQTHRLRNAHSNKTFCKSDFQMPAINGNIKLVIGDGMIDASASVSMEKITLEGAAVYGVMSTIGAASTAEGLAAIKADAAAIQDQITWLFPPSSKEELPSTKAATMIKFDGRGTLAGLAISADAPSIKQSDSSASLLLDISSIRIKASNRAEDGLAPLPFPMILVTVDEVAAELRQMEMDRLRLAGKLSLKVRMICEVERQPNESFMRTIRFSLVGPTVDLGVATAPVIVDVLSHMQTRVSDLDLSSQKRTLRRLRGIEKQRPETLASSNSIEEKSKSDDFSALLYTSFEFDLKALRVSYMTDDPSFRSESRDPHDLVLSLEAIQLATRSQAEAKLNLKNLQLALEPKNETSEVRPNTSALMPEVVFNVEHRATKTERRLAFQAAGKALDLQLDPQFVLPTSDIERSLSESSKRLREALKNLDVAPRSTAGGGGVDAKKLLGDRNLSSLIVDADFAGATVSLRSPRKAEGRRTTLGVSRSQRGHYGPFIGDEGASASLRAPGIALKVQYTDPGKIDPRLNVELKVNASKNELNPSVVPFILQVSDTIKKVVREDNEEKHDANVPPENHNSTIAFDPDQTLERANPKAILGKTQLNIGIRICKQEFSLSCQPIAKVAASAKFDDIYVTINNVDSKIKNDHFFAASANFKGLNATLQHVYSRTITFSFDIESIMLSVMNSRHISGVNGIEAILRVAPTKTQLNAKQMQDILLFREIWFPVETRSANRNAAAQSAGDPHEYFMHRYQQVVGSSAFTWNATFFLTELALDLDLGQSIGKISSRISNLWANSTKSSTSRQNLCVGIDEVDIHSSGRLSGFVDLDKVKVRTSIAWPDIDQANNAPSIQGAVGFDRLCVKIAFDYNAFAVADITSFEFIMYNARDPSQRGGDRLVAILDGEKVNVYCTASSAALSLSLHQAFERLIQEKKSAYEQSLHDIEKYMRRTSSVYPPRPPSNITAAAAQDTTQEKRTPISLHTDVVVTLRSVDVGAFPSSLLDQQILRFEASDIQARFAVVLEDGKIHSGLGMTLGQLRVALASNPQPNMPKTLGEITIDEVTQNAHSARGGVILRVPKVVAAMQTWQAPKSNNIEYIFRSSFEGKIDVGWNYSRISFIRGMYATHTRTLANRLGKPLPEPAVKIKGAPEAPLGPSVLTGHTPGRDGINEPSDTSLPRPPGMQQKITAEVALPESKYTYTPLEAPIIETPQLRDMGEATPPLEWVGLQRERLPNVTHQIVIVTLLEVAKEVEDAYGKILGRA